MKLSPSGLRFLEEQESEGGVPRLKAYSDTGGVWTIGFGHTDGVKQGDTCTAQQAYAWLSEDAEWAENAVLKLVPRELDQNQFNALVSFVFNIGDDAFKNSTMRKLLLADRDELAAEEFVKWRYDNHVEIAGLKARRLREKALFLTPYDA